MDGIFGLRAPEKNLSKLLGSREILAVRRHFMVCFVCEVRSCNKVKSFQRIQEWGISQSFDKKGFCQIIPMFMNKEHDGFSVFFLSIKIYK